jgi:hypothetical protein
MAPVSAEASIDARADPQSLASCLSILPGFVSAPLQSTGPAKRSITIGNLGWNTCEDPDCDTPFVSIVVTNVMSPTSGEVPRALSVGRILIKYVVELSNPCPPWMLGTERLFLSYIHLKNGVKIIATNFSGTTFTQYTSLATRHFRADTSLVSATTVPSGYLPANDEWIAGYFPIATSNNTGGWPIRIAEKFKLVNEGCGSSVIAMSGVDETIFYNVAKLTNDAGIDISSSILSPTNNYTPGQPGVYHMAIMWSVVTYPSMTYSGGLINQSPPVALLNASSQEELTTTTTTPVAVVPVPLPVAVDRNGAFLPPIRGRGAPS